MIFTINFLYHDIYIKLLITKTVIILSAYLEVLAGVPPHNFNKSKFYSGRN